MKGHQSKSQNKEQVTLGINISADEHSNLDLQTMQTAGHDIHNNNKTIHFHFSPLENLRGRLQVVSNPLDLATSSALLPILEKSESSKRITKTVENEEGVETTITEEMTIKTTYIVSTNAVDNNKTPAFCLSDHLFSQCFSNSLQMCPIWTSTLPTTSIPTKSLEQKDDELSNALKFYY